MKDYRSSTTGVQSLTVNVSYWILFEKASGVGKTGLVLILKNK